MFGRLGSVGSVGTRHTFVARRCVRYRHAALSVSWVRSWHACMHHASRKKANLTASRLTGSGRCKGRRVVVCYFEDRTTHDDDAKQNPTSWGGTFSPLRCVRGIGGWVWNSISRFFYSRPSSSWIETYRTILPGRTMAANGRRAKETRPD